MYTYVYTGTVHVVTVKSLVNKTLCVTTNKLEKKECSEPLQESTCGSWPLIYCHIYYACKKTISYGITVKPV